ncbi:MAG: MEDS domain-containing protein [Firmicutes bacterium]|nr:MEDS domain-containing protein [Bacillota bacterium]
MLTLRKTGLDILGDVHWGTHFCQFYKTKKDLVDILIPYFKAGLENNEFCMWVTSAPLNEKEAEYALRDTVPDFDRYLDNGQIEIIPYVDWYLKEGVFDSKRVLNGWVDKLNQALAKGYDGLRLAGNTFWLEETDWRDFVNYEAEVDSVIGSHRMIAICTYSLERCAASEVIDVIRNHEFAIIKYEGKWEVVESVELKQVREALKQSEEALRASEQKYRALFNGMDDGVALYKIVYDSNRRPVDFIITDVNPQYEIMLGIGREKTLGQRATLLYGTELKSYLNAFLQAAETGKTVSFETYFSPTDKYFNVAVFALHNGELAVIFSDITEQKQSEREKEHLLNRLSVERNRLQTIMESTNAHIAYLDHEFNFVLVNSTYVRASGHTEEELIGRNHFDLFPNEENEEIFKKVRDTGVPVEYKAKPFEYVDQPWRGVTYWDWTLTPVKDRTGKVAGLVLSLVDVTEITRAKKLSDSLNDINAAISSTFNMDEILRIVAAESTIAIGCEGSIIGLCEDGAWAVRCTYGLAEEPANKSFLGKEACAIMLTKKTKEPVVISDTSSGKWANFRFTGLSSVRSALLVPLVVKDEPIGIISFVYTSAPVAFTDDKIDFARKLAASVSFALDSAKLYAAERSIADTLQEAILTLPRSIEGIDFGSLYRSATEVAKVGGDFYDLFEIKPGKIGIIVGDVSGKGLEASAMTSFIKNTIKAYAHDEDSPALAVAKTNDLAAKSSPPSNFITLLFGILEVGTGRFVYCSAGHPPAILSKKTDGTILLTSRSPLVGVFAGLNYDNREVMIEKGDVLVLYTDGAIEARSADGGLFGEDRLAKLVEGLKNEKICDMPQLIFENIVDYAGGKLQDDVAILAVGLTESGDALDPTSRGGK